MVTVNKSLRHTFITDNRSLLEEGVTQQHTAQGVKAYWYGSHGVIYRSSYDDRAPRAGMRPDSTTTTAATMYDYDDARSDSRAVICAVKGRLSTTGGRGVRGRTSRFRPRS